MEIFVCQWKFANELMIDNEEDEALLNPFIDEADRFDFAAYLYKGKVCHIHRFLSLQI